MPPDHDPPTAQRDVIDALAHAGILPIVRTIETSTAHNQVDRLLAAGAEIIELTTTIPGWTDLLCSVAEANPHTMFGVGTVTEAADAESAIAGGASFLVSPYPVPAVREAATRAGIPFIEGAFSPGELAVAGRCGIAKLFPAHIGGIAYLRSVSPILPGCAIVPSGGIRLDEVGDWLDAGALAVGVGRELFTVDDLTGRFTAARNRGTERAR